MFFFFFFFLILTKLKVDLSSEILCYGVLRVVANRRSLIQFGGQYDSLLHGKLLFNSQKLTPVLTLRQGEFGGKRKRMQVDIT